MSVYQINVINKEFDASETVDAASPSDAKTQAMKGALEIGVDEVLKGVPFFGAEIRISEGDTTIERMMVAVGVTPLRA